jgi:hypothetical protein
VGAGKEGGGGGGGGPPPPPGGRHVWLCVVWCGVAGRCSHIWKGIWCSKRGPVCALQLHGTY